MGGRTSTWRTGHWSVPGHPFPALSSLAVPTALLREAACGAKRTESESCQPFGCLTSMHGYTPAGAAGLDGWLRLASSLKSPALRSFRLIRTSLMSLQSPRLRLDAADIFIKRGFFFVRSRNAGFEHVRMADLIECFFDGQFGRFSHAGLGASVWVVNRPRRSRCRYHRAFRRENR